MGCCNSQYHNIAFFEQGPPGPQGAQGIQGETGVGVPEGGEEGQILVKSDENCEWKNINDLIDIDYIKSKLEELEIDPRIVFYQDD